MRALQESDPRGDTLADAQSSLARLAGEVEAEEALLATVGEQVEEEKQRVLRQVRE